ARGLVRRLGVQAPVDSVAFARASDALLEAVGRNGDPLVPAERQMGERAIRIKELHFGPEHLETATSPSRPGVMLEGAGARGAGDLRGSRQLLERCLAIDEKHLPGDSVEVANTLHSLGTTLYRQGEYDAAETCVRRSLAMRQRLDGPQSRSVGLSITALGALQ